MTGDRLEHGETPSSSQRRRGALAAGQARRRIRRTPSPCPIWPAARGPEAAGGDVGRGAKPEDYGLEKPVGEGHVVWTDPTKPAEEDRARSSSASRFPGTDITPRASRARPKVLFVPASSSPSAEEDRRRLPEQGRLRRVRRRTSPRIEIQRGRGRLVLARKDGIWWLDASRSPTSPTRDEADRLVGAADGAAGAEFIHATARTWRRWGCIRRSTASALTDAKGAVDVASTSARRARTGTPSTRGARVRSSRSSATIVDELSKEAEAFRERALVAFDRGDVAGVDGELRRGRASRSTQEAAAGARTAARSSPPRRTTSDARSSTLKSKSFLDEAAAKALAARRRRRSTIKTEGGARPGRSRSIRGRRRAWSRACLAAARRLRWSTATPPDSSRPRSARPRRSAARRGRRPSAGSRTREALDERAVSVFPVRCGGLLRRPPPRARRSASGAGLSFSSATFVFFSLALRSIVESEKSMPRALRGLGPPRRRAPELRLLELRLGEVGVGEVGALRESRRVKSAPIARANRRSASCRFAPVKLAPIEQGARQVGVEGPAAGEVRRASGSPAGSCRARGPRARSSRPRPAPPRRRRPANDAPTKE